MIDPFTQVYTHIRNALVDDTDLTAIVPANNILDLTDNNQSPFKEQLLPPADFPFLRLLPTGSEMNFIKTQNSTIVQAFDLEIATGEDMLADTVQTQTLYFPLKWAVIQALYPLVSGASFVDDSYIVFSLQGLELSDTVEGRDDSLLDEGTLGWESVLTITATLSLPVATMEG